MIIILMSHGGITSSMIITKIIQKNHVRSERNMIKVPIKYYVNYWIKGSILATATGMLVIIFIPPIAIRYPYFFVIGFILYQVYFFRLLISGEKRSDLEFNYFKNMKNKLLFEEIKRKYGFLCYLKFRIDEYSQFRNFQTKILFDMLNYSNSCKIGNLVYFKLAEIARLSDSTEKEKVFLEKALDSKKEDVYYNILLAICYEKLGDGIMAIKRYEMVINLCGNISEALKSYIEKQINRVKSNGPRRKPPIPGLRFLTW